MTFDTFCIHQSSRYLVLHSEDTMTEGSFLAQLLTFHLKNIFCNLLIPPFLIHEFKRSVPLFVFVSISWLGRKYTAHLLISGKHFLVNQTSSFPMKKSHDKKSLIDLSSSSLLLAWAILRWRHLTSAIWLTPCSDLFAHLAHACSRWKLQMNISVSANNFSNALISFSSKSTIPNFVVTV